jgi:hypothetical protein
MKPCYYCDNVANKILIWLKDKGGNPTRRELNWCGCDLQIALKRFWVNPYKVVEGVDYEVEELKVQCEDCGVSYESLLCDFVLPDQQWEIIADGASILCANCIGKRVVKLGGTVMLCWANNIEYR